ncbi:MAG: tRNA (adenosine(37)-N6)-dimethylallyltransferase MiaA [Candidatus Neomarinimicrobiota bacterium]|nr:MAG: tRNA (adenosine(37)-N6)-dimethylallyltransferase MiaA [Candidatus Neomarinimicrobiota bacterium]
MDNNRPNPKPILAIVGPTAIGKTTVAIDVAKKVNGEVIGLDSRQIYKGMAIGTAQPTIEELAAVPHHLIGVKDPDLPISAGKYAKLVLNLVKDISERGKEPVICGGAGLYYRAITKGIFSESKTDLDVREKLIQEYEEAGPEGLLNRLLELDPEYAVKVHPNNKKRLIRALEIYTVTGKPPSEHFNRQAKSGTPTLDFFTVLLTLDRKELDKRIEKRTARMLDSGWIEETKMLRKGNVAIGMHPMDSIGYRQISAFLDGKLNKVDLEAEIILRTCQYARRQLQWFRQENIDLTIDIEIEPDKVADHIVTGFNKH